MDVRPDIVVLGAGGVLGEAWMSGVLVGIEDSAGIDLRECDYLVGTSAGAVVAAGLAAGRALRRPPSPPDPIAQTPAGHRGTGIQSVAGRLLRPARPLISPTLTLTAPLGALARAAALRAIPTGSGGHPDLADALDGLQASFDGRLRITAVKRRSGERVVFGSPGAPQASVADAVNASCAVPGIYAPVTIDQTDYVDGGFWSPTNADAAPARRDARVLCLAATASTYGPLSPAIRVPCRTITELELATLRARGADVRLITPDRASATALGADLLLREPTHAALAAGYAQGLDA